MEQGSRSIFFVSNLNKEVSDRVRGSYGGMPWGLPNVKYEILHLYKKLELRKSTGRLNVREWSAA